MQMDFNSPKFFCQTSYSPYSPKFFTVQYLMWSSTITHSDLHMMEATDIELVHLIHMVISDLTDIYPVKC